jgi:hypothetical protein
MESATMLVSQKEEEEEEEEIKNIPRRRRHLPNRRCWAIQWWDNPMIFSLGSDT